ncbi:MAG: hypothetical protein ACRBFS_22920 [Aureispira sp.]
MKPLWMALIYSIYLVLLKKETIVFILSIILLAFYDKVVLLVGFSLDFICQVPTHKGMDAIWFFNTGTTALDGVLSVLTTLGGIYGIVKTWGGFKTWREKQKTTREEAEGLLDHTKKLTNDLLEMQSEMVTFSTRVHAEIMRLKAENNAKDETIMGFVNSAKQVKSKCNNNCHE